MRDGTVLEYGQGTFTVKARMKLYTLIKQAEADNEELCKRYGATPQKLIYSDELDQLIKKQWQQDLIERPWVEDAMEVGMYYEKKIKGLDAYELIINFHHESFSATP
jgi:DNA sulfur modification protein DndC